jgi:DNA-binding CsgD family transcriptional regulator
MGDQSKENCVVDLASDLGRAVLDTSSFPVFVLSEGGRVLDVNEAACRYFGQTRAELIGIDALGVRGYSPSRRAGFGKRYAAWLNGELAPFLIAWPPRTGPDEFLVFPQRAAYRGRGAVAVPLIPVREVEAALAQRAAGPRVSASKALQALATVPPQDGSELERLTPREWEIARRLAEGDRVPLIVEDLGIAENTVRNHLKSIFRKLGVGSQSELIRLLRRRTTRAAS